MTNRRMLPKLSCSTHDAIEGSSVIRTVRQTSSPKNPDGHGHGRGKPCLEESTARLGSSDLRPRSAGALKERFERLRGLPARALSSEPSASPAAASESLSRGSDPFLSALRPPPPATSGAKAVRRPKANAQKSQTPCNTVPLKALRNMLTLKHKIQPLQSTQLDAGGWGSGWRRVLHSVSPG